MRLICPNCDAEYNVDDSAIPDTGRDVQCSNCGHAWFQLPPEVEAALADEDALFSGLPDDDEDAPPELTADAEPRRKMMDDDLLAVLREEAEREAAARRAETPPIETQVEMEMPAPAAPAPTPVPPAPVLDPAARRVAQLKGIDPDARPVAPARPGSRRELLPDIEEINSTLKHTQRADQDDGAEPQTIAAGGSGFRSGFLLVLLAAAIGVSAYLMAPSLSAQIPGAAPALDAYVAQVDAGRLWLDGVLRSATAVMQGLSERTGG